MQRGLRWMHAPIASRGLTLGAILLAGAALTTLFWAAMTRYMQPLFFVSDADWYLRLAAGDGSHVMQPWASRQLGALVVRGLAQTLPINLRQGFVAEAAAALFATVLIVSGLLARARAPRWMLLAAAILPSWGLLVQYLALPDLWYAALIAVLLAMLYRGWMWAACGMMLPLMLSRESTSLTLLCFLFAAWASLGWLQRAAAVTAAATGAVVVHRLAAHAMQNVERIPQALYLFAKVPWNFMRNVLGVLPWSNVNTSLCKVPAWRAAVNLGRVEAVGVCGFSMHQQVAALTAAMLQFGLLPLLFLAVWVQRRMRRDDPVLLRFSLIYGGACFLTAPLLGAGFAHLVGYAWPLFVVAGPMLLREVCGLESWAGSRASGALAFAALHLGLCATAYWFPPVWVRTLVNVTFWMAGFFALKVWFGRGWRKSGHAA